MLALLKRYRATRMVISRHLDMIPRGRTPIRKLYRPQDVEPESIPQTQKNRHFPTSTRGRRAVQLGLLLARVADMLVERDIAAL